MSSSERVWVSGAASPRRSMARTPLLHEAIDLREEAAVTAARRDVDLGQRATGLEDVDDAPGDRTELLSGPGRPGAQNHAVVRQPLADTSHLVDLPHAFEDQSNGLDGRNLDRRRRQARPPTRRTRHAATRRDRGSSARSARRGCSITVSRSRRSSSMRASPSRSCPRLCSQCDKRAQQLAFGDVSHRQQVLAVELERLVGQAVHDPAVA